MSAPHESNGHVLHAGELEIRVGEGLVLARGRALTLSVHEFALLVALAARAGGIVRRDELYRAAWRSEQRNGDRSVDVYISKLRGKLRAAMPDRSFIHTHHGFGYRLNPERSQDVDNSSLRAMETHRLPGGARPPSPGRSHVTQAKEN